MRKSEETRNTFKASEQWWSQFLETLIGVAFGLLLFSVYQGIHKNIEKLEENEQLVTDESEDFLTNTLRESERFDKNISANSPQVINDKRPKFWFHNTDYDFSIFGETATVLERLGLQQIPMNFTSDALNFVHMDWDLVWSYNYISSIPIDWKNIQPHQKVNHFPGSYPLVSKSHLSTMIPSKHIPRGFRTVEALTKYAKENPEKRFVEKNKQNRGVSIKNVSEMNFQDDELFRGIFAQEYVENPLLIDGHKFDFSNYVLITSINPLRIYWYSKHTVLRICPLPYDANDTSNMDRHVIGEVHTASLDFPAVKKYTDLGYTPKQALIAIMNERNLDHEKLYRDLEQIIVDTVIKRESFFIDELYHPAKRNFFELYRFDFMVNQEQNGLKLNLIEINQHPIMSASSPKLIKFKSKFENILYNTLTLVGVGTYWKKDHFSFNSEEEKMMLMGQGSIEVMPEVCANLPCTDTCDPQCEHCKRCLSDNQLQDLELAYLETMNMGEFKRIFPLPNDTYKLMEADYFESLSLANRHHSKWFIEMCNKNKKFC